MDDVRLTPVEAEVMREQGKEIGPTVDERPVRQMSGDELSSMLLRLSFLADMTANKSRREYLERQIGKVRRELERRAGR